MNTLTALLVFASHITTNSTPDGGLNELTKDCTMTTNVYGDQNMKYAMLVNVRIFSVRRLPRVLDRRTVWLTMDGWPSTSSEVWDLIWRTRIWVLRRCRNVALMRSPVKMRTAPYTVEYDDDDLDNEDDGDDHEDKNCSRQYRNVEAGDYTVWRILPVYTALYHHHRLMISSSSSSSSSPLPYAFSVFCSVRRHRHLSTDTLPFYLCCYLGHSKHHTYVPSFSFPSTSYEIADDDDGSGNSDADTDAGTIEWNGYSQCRPHIFWLTL